MELLELVKLPPELPVVWTPNGSLRFGLDSPQLTIPNPDTALQRFLAELASGLPRLQLLTIALKSGLKRSAALNAIRTLEPLLIAVPQTQNSIRSPRVVVHSKGSTGMTLARVFRAAEYQVRISEDATDPEIDLVVFTERYLGDPRDPGRWLAAGLPHLLIRFCERTVQVGPIFSDSGPCHGCLSHAEMDRDPDWAFCSTQLIGARSTPESSPLLALSAAHALSMAERWRAGDRAVHSEQVHIAQATAASPPSITEHDLSPHPECGCGIFAQSAESGPHLTDRTAA